MTTLTLIAVAVVAYGLWKPHRYATALALGGATPAGAALVAGSTAVPTFYFVALGALLVLFVQLVHRSRTRRRLEHPVTPGTTPLLLLAVWAVVVTVAAPLLFDGMTVYAAGGVPNQLRAGSLTSSNQAQIVYAVLSVAVVVLLARGAGARTQVVGLAAGLTMVLSLWAYAGKNLGVPFPTGFFDNSPAFAYIDGAPGGVIRFRGIFSEPAGLAVACLVTIAYMTARLPQVRGLRRVGVGVVLAIAVFLGSISTSTTFIVSIALLVAMAVGVWLVEVVIARRELTLSGVSGAAAALAVLPFVVPLVLAFLTGEVSAKVGTSSYRDRSSADGDSYRIVLDTFGFGVGLGSNRPSSFLAAMLSTVGLIGTVLFVAAVVVLVRRTWTLRGYRPVVWALAAALLTKLISGPDLNDTSGLMWLCLGVLAHAAAARQREEALEQTPRGQHGAAALASRDPDDEDAPTPSR